MTYPSRFDCVARRSRLRVRARARTVGLFECRRIDVWDDVAEMLECVFTRDAGSFKAGDLAHRVLWYPRDMRFDVYVGRDDARCVRLSLNVTESSL